MFFIFNLYLYHVCLFPSTITSHNSRNLIMIKLTFNHKTYWFNRLVLISNCTRYVVGYKPFSQSNKEFDMSEYKLPQSRSDVKRELISIFTSWVDNRFGEDDVDSCWFNLMSSDLVTLHKDLIEKSGLRQLAAIKAVDEEFFGILREMIESDLIRQFENIGKEAIHS